LRLRALLFVPLFTISLAGCIGTDSDALVVYCAHDAIFSQQILDDFTKETGIAVTPRFDTEATKSLGLVNLIIREADAPRCDVFWNNETLGTIDLANRGLTEAYKGNGYERIPAAFTDPHGNWCGFAARLRVWIVNTDAFQPTQDAVEQAFKDRLADFTWAKPLYGTTLPHYCVLWAVEGESFLKELDAKLRKTAVPAASNGQTRDLVANGTCAFGWTDTDDYFGAVDARKTVGMVPVTVGDGRTICIPNSVAIIKGTKHRETAEKFVDYLLSREVELRLARSESRQIPLGEIGDADLPAEVAQLVPAAAKGIDLSQAAAVRGDVLKWLTETYTN
jgi:iron(III) transport system substrate-binding protein